MKIFWSWQSDTPGKTGRHFIRDALDLAVEQLRSELTIDDCDRPEELHVDQDRQGVPGSPDLVPTILKKIDEATVFVADVTAVARREKGGSILNSNVALELGYAFKSLGDSNVLLVLNTHYGQVEELPFDLRHKAGSIRYALNESPTQEDKGQAHRDLARQFKDAIGLIIRSRKPVPIQSQMPFSRRVAKQGNSLPFQIGIPFCEGDHGKVRFAGGPIAYLRITPTIDVPKIKRSAIIEAMRKGGIRPLAHAKSTYGDFGRSELGEFEYWFDPQDQNLALCFSMMTANGEIWTGTTQLAETPPSYPSLVAPAAMEKRFSECFLNLAATLTSLIPNIGQSLWLQAGLEGFSGIPLYFPPQHGGGTYRIVSNSILWDGETAIPSTLGAARMLLVPFFERVWDDCGLERPLDFRID